MERGPYDRQPGDPAYVRREPAYAPPPEYEPPPERRFGVAEAVAIFALVVAMVAVFLAIDAREEGSDDEQVASQVRREVDLKVRQIRSTLGQRAGAAREQAQAAESEAERTRAALTDLRTQISALRKRDRALQTQLNQARSTIQLQSDAISDLRRESGSNAR